CLYLCSLAEKTSHLFLQVSNFYDLLTTSRFGRTSDDVEDPNQVAMSIKSSQGIPRMASLGMSPIPMSPSDEDSSPSLTHLNDDDQLASPHDDTLDNSEPPLSDLDDMTSDDSSIEGSSSKSNN